MNYDLNRNVMLDGGAASTQHLLRPTCADAVDNWVLRLPDEVAETHSRFASAGSAILLTCTIHTLPVRSKNWREVVERAVLLARQRVSAAEVWATIGPASLPGHRWTDAGFDDRARLTASWREMAMGCEELGAEGFAL